MLRNNASGPEIGLPGRIFGRILDGKTSTSALRPAFGWAEGRFEAFPNRIRPKSGPRSPARKPDLRPGSVVAEPNVALVTGWFVFATSRAVRQPIEVGNP